MKRLIGLVLCLAILSGMSAVSCADTTTLNSGKIENSEGNRISVD